MSDSCVYIHYLGDEIIYVGSGTKERAFSHHNRSKEHEEDMKKENFRCEIFMDNLDRYKAFKIEYELGYKYVDLGQAKYFGHDMRGNNNPMANIPLTELLNEEEIKHWKKKLSEAITGEKNGYRTECIVIAPFEEDESKKQISFPTLIEAKKYIKENYGFSYSMIDKAFLDKPYNPSPRSFKKYRKYKGLLIKRINFIGKRV